MYRQYKAPMFGGLRAPRYIGYGTDILARTQMSTQQINALQPTLSLAALNASLPKPSTPVQTSPWTKYRRADAAAASRAATEEESTFVMARGTGGGGTSTGGGGGGGGGSTGSGSGSGAGETVESCTAKGLYLSFNAPICVPISVMDSNCAKELPGAMYDMAADACVKSSKKPGGAGGAHTGTKITATTPTTKAASGTTPGAKSGANAAMIAGAAALTALLLLR